MAKPKAYSYLRFSTPEQSKGDSFRRQTELARRYATENELELVEGDYSDEGISAFRGKNHENGALADFLDAVKAQVIPKGSYLLVENLDRISRNIPRKANRILEDICDEGITVVTLGDHQVYSAKRLNEEPMSMMLSLLHFIRAHDESVVKSKRVSAAWQNKRNKAGDKPLTARAPAWLELDKKAGKFLLIPERAEIIRDIFRQYLEGTGPKLIAKRLNESQQPPWGRGNYWHESYINKILDNHSVIGTMIPHKMVHDDVGKRRVPLEPLLNYFPAVLDPEVFDRVRELRKTGTNPGKPEIKNLFFGLAVCPKCGGTMMRINKSRGSGKWVYLVCRRAKSGAGCKYQTVRYYDLDQAFIAGFRSAIPSLPTADKRIDGLREAIDFQCNKMADYKAQLSNIMEMVKSGSINYETSLGVPDNEEVEKILESAGLLFPKTVTDEILNLEQVIETCRNNIDKLQEQYDAATPVMIERKIKDAMDAIDAGADLKLINAALRGLCEKIVIDYDEKKCLVHFRHAEVVLQIPW